MNQVYKTWLFDGILPDILKKDVGNALDDFKKIYDALKDKKRSGVERRLFMIAFHAYIKRGQSEEREMPSSIMALCQYEGYAKKIKRWKILECYGDKIVEAKNITQSEDAMLDKIISIVKGFRELWGIPAFKIIQPYLDHNELDETLEYVGRLIEKKSGYTDNLDFSIKEAHYGSANANN